jgi:hypothetical protein
VRGFLLLALFVSAAASSSHAAGSVLLRGQVAPKEITIGDPVNFTITVLYSSGITTVPVEFPKVAGDFEILSAVSSQPRPAKDDRLSVIHKLTLTTFSTGTINIPPLSLYFKNPDGTMSEAKTDEIAITVTSVLAQKGDEGHLRPLKGLFDVRSFWWLWMLLAAALLGAGVWGWQRHRRSRGEKTPAGPPPPLYSPEEEAERALAALEAGPLVAEQQWKDVYSELSTILRRYVERRYATTAQELTSSELLAAFRRFDVPSEPAFAARTLLDNADMVKFAKWTPPVDDVTADVARLRAFVSGTTPQPPQPEPENEPTPEEPMPL